MKHFNLIRLMTASAALSAGISCKAVKGDQFLVELNPSTTNLILSDSYSTCADPTKKAGAPLARFNRIKLQYKGSGKLTVDSITVKVRSGADAKAQVNAIDSTEISAVFGGTTTIDKSVATNQDELDGILKSECALNVPISYKNTDVATAFNGSVIVNATVEDGDEYQPMRAEVPITVNYNP